LDNYFTKKIEEKKKDESPEFDRLKRMLDSLKTKGQANKFIEGLLIYSNKKIITNGEYVELITMSNDKIKKLKK
jgi:hypothetical protein